ncbi:unnamed protein product, partial [Polarella glacialis]
PPPPPGGVLGSVASVSDPPGAGVGAAAQGFSGGGGAGWDFSTRKPRKERPPASPSRSRNREPPKERRARRTPPKRRSRTRTPPRRRSRSRSRRDRGRDDRRRDRSRSRSKPKRDADGGAGTSQPAEEWKDDGGEIDPIEKRQDPQDKEYHTFEELKVKYEGKLSAEEAEKRWREEMKPWIVVRRMEQAQALQKERENRKQDSNRRNRSPSRRRSVKRSSRSREGSRVGAKEAAAEWKDDGGDIKADEIRTHPEDKECYTFASLKEKFPEQKPEELEALWREKMKPPLAVEELGRAVAEEWKDDGAPVDPVEKRQDPSGGSFCTFSELGAKSGEKAPEELEAMWRLRKPESVVTREQASKKAEPLEPRKGSRSRSRRKSEKPQDRRRSRSRSRRSRRRGNRSRSRRRSRSRGSRTRATGVTAPVQQPRPSAADWKDDNGTIKPDEKRVHPEDRQCYSFAELKAKFGETVAQEELERFWRAEMKPEWVAQELEYKKAVDWKDDGADISTEESRQHPEDKQSYNFEQLKAKDGQSSEDLEAANKSSAPGVAAEPAESSFAVEATPVAMLSKVE